MNNEIQRFDFKDASLPDDGQGQAALAKELGMSEKTVSERL
ncbi:hypothetical protein [Bifidobacterium catenulatum]|nr:hypothetical protein [Bifidobacterium catenulatum]KFI53623.1 hypothetical protein BCAT_1439 [Bifidobacterium catenulatum DSM 16992 = JCM 1194 = LMG 11043]